ncbi:MAG: hypothetical protein ACTSUR_03200 [Candidatus Heimdallarchaeaceae archaeon]
MSKKFHSSSRAVSEVLAAIIILALVIASSVIVGVVLLNVDVIKLPGFFESPTTQKVHISLVINEINDTDEDSKFDELTLFISLSTDSPSIYLNDIDLLLPTGETIDDTVPWIISYTSQLWNSEFNGYAIPLGTINSTFIITPENTISDEGEITTGSSLYIVVRYTYVIQSGSRLEQNFAIYETPLITF